MSSAIHALDNTNKTASQEWNAFMHGDFNKSMQTSAQMKATEAMKNPPVAPVAPVVDSGSSSNANNLGRAALIATGSQGVQGTSPTGRLTLLGN